MDTWFDKIIESIDWQGDYNTELKRVQTLICNALLVPLDQLVVTQDSDGERLYWKLWNLAREDRAKIRKKRIAQIAEVKYGHLSLARANSLATLDYAKELEQQREQVVYKPDNKTAITASTKAKAKAAYEKNLSTYKDCTKGINNMINLDYSHLSQIQVWYGNEED
jgi:hypothetical protein